jgi:3-isopropylmalate dehydratase small subunit
MSLNLTLRGKVWKVGDNIDTDVIIPARYLVTFDPTELGQHCLESLDRTLASRISPGDILVARENFGCGSSREHAPLALKGCGISCVIAVSFARIFFRNSINVGLPIIEHPELAREVQAGEVLQVDMAQGIAENLTQKKSYQIEPYPPFLVKIIQTGGLINYVKEELGRVGK